MRARSLIRSVEPDQYGPGPVLDALGPEGREIVLDVARRAIYEQSGAEFFDGLAHFLCAVVGAELVVVGAIASEEVDVIRTIARYRFGERTPNIRYALAGTPCGTVVGPQHECIYPTDVAKLFPEDPGLSTMGAQGYLGMPLFARNGERLGLLALITTRPMEDVVTLSALLRMLGSRASLELEYELAQERGAVEAGELASLLDDEDHRLRSALG